MAERAAGLVVSRARYEQVPARVRAWAEDRLGSPVVTTHEQSGGMSPGCATRVVCADGTRGFVKAVGVELNPDTPTLFRRERGALALIGPGPGWADLLATYDDGAWVALLLEDVEGHEPDLADPDDAARVVAAVDDLVVELARRVPHPPDPDPDPWPGTGGLMDLRVVVRTWTDSVDLAVAHDRGADVDLLPAWIGRQAERLREGLQALRSLPAEQLVHCDIRSDNLLVRPGGEVVVVDWGGAGVGPAWLDPFLARLQRADDPWFDVSLRSSPVLRDVDPDQVTSLLLAFGCHLTWRAHVARDVNLPRLAAFRRHHAGIALRGAARRLGVTGADDG